MKKMVLIFLILISLISAYSFSPSQQTEVKVFVSNGTNASGSVNEGGGGSGGSSSGGTQPIETISKKELCKSSWECDEWGECINLQKSRICIDKNECFIPPIKLESGWCIKELITEKEPTTNIPYWIFILLFFIIIILIIILTRRKSRKTHKKK